MSTSAGGAAIDGTVDPPRGRRHRDARIDRESLVHGHVHRRRLPNAIPRLWRVRGLCRPDRGRGSAGSSRADRDPADPARGHGERFRPRAARTYRAPRVARGDRRRRARVRRAVGAGQVHGGGAACASPAPSSSPTTCSRSPPVPPSHASAAPPSCASAPRRPRSRTRTPIATRSTADQRLALGLAAAPLGPLPLAGIVVPGPSRTATKVAVRRVDPSTGLFAVLAFPRSSAGPAPT